MINSISLHIYSSRRFVIRTCSAPRPTRCGSSNVERITRTTTPSRSFARSEASLEILARYEPSARGRESPVPEQKQFRRQMAEKAGDHRLLAMRRRPHAHGDFGMGPQLDQAELAD